MNSDAIVPVPRTGVPLGIADPVERARTELKAALAAIEEKGNLPRRASRAYDRAADRAREFSQRNPALAAAGVIAAAAAVGALVWAAVRAYSR